MIVYHTEVLPECEGKGWAKKLLEVMVRYAREKKLMVIPLCPFVHAQFSAHPAEYSDIWRQFKKWKICTGKKKYRLSCPGM